MKKQFILILIFLAACISYSQENKENTDYRLAVNLYNDKLYDLALEQFKRFIELYPNTQQGIQSKYYIGLAQFELKKYEEAKNSFQNFALTFTLHPQAPEAWWKIAESNLKMNKINDAALAFERIKVFHPTSELAPKGLVKSADCYIAQNDYENSQRVLKTLLAEYFSSSIAVEAHKKLAEVYMNLNMPDQAADEYGKIIGSDLPKDDKTNAQLSLGRLYVSSGRTELAENLFKEVILNNSLNKIADTAKIELGKLYFEIGDYQNSKYYFKGLIDTSASTGNEVDKIALYHLAQIEFQSKDYLSALKYIQSYEDKYSQDSSIAVVWFLTAETHRKLSDFVKSNEYFKKIIENKNSGTDIKKSYLYYAQNCIDVKNFNEALEYYQKYIEAYPSDQLIPELIYRSGKIYLENLKDYRRAVAKFDELISKHGSSRFADDALLGLATAYETNKELDKALNKYNELIENYSNSPYYDYAKEKISHINLFVSSNNTDGFKKIGILLQDVINNKPKGEISYKLGEVYYNDMKDYKSALAQFDVALSANNLSDSLKSLSSYYRMMSAYYIAISEGSSSAEAKAGLSEYLNANPNSPKRAELILKLFNLDQIGKTKDEVLSLSKEYINKYPDLQNRDEFLGKALSIAMEKKDYNACLEFSGKLINDFSSSQYIQDALYGRAYAAILTGSDTTAEKYFNEYLAKYKDGKHVAGSYFYLADIAERKGDFQKTFEYYNKIKNNFSYTEFADNIQEMYADAYYKSGDFKSSFRQYNQLFLAAQQNIFTEDELYSYLYKLAQSAEKGNDLVNAKKYYKQYIQKSPNGDFINEALLSLGIMYQKEGKKDAALSYFKLIKNNSKNNDLNIKIANLLYSAGQFKIALDNYKSVLSNPESSKYRKEALFKAALLCFKLDNFTEAENYKKNYDKEFSLKDAEEAELKYEEGLFYYRQKNYQNAEKTFSDVVDDFESTEFAAWSAYWKGKMLESSDKFQDAQKNYLWVIEKFPGSEPAIETNLSLGNYYFRSEKYAEAVKYYRSISEKPIKDPVSYLAALDNIIEAYYQLQIYDAAIEYCRKYISSFPNDKSIPDKKLKIGILYQKLRYFDQAIVHYQSLISGADAALEVEIRYYLGECYFSKGDYQQALLEFMKVPYISNKNTKVDWVPAALYMSGQSYEKLNKYEQAITMYKQIIEKPNIDNTYKAQAQKEIDRVNALILPQKENK